MIVVDTRIVVVVAALRIQDCALGVVMLELQKGLEFIVEVVSGYLHQRFYQHAQKGEICVQIVGGY